MPDDAEPPQITIRAMREEDLPAVTAIRNLPGARWGTLALPFESVAGWRKRRAGLPAPGAMLVACLGETIVGELWLGPSRPARRAHAAGIGIMVHDDWRGRGVGTALFAALTDLADNWLNLRRLELEVYADNVAALALYRKFGFEVEATLKRDAYRDGALVDSLAMARLHGDLPRDASPHPPPAMPAPAGPFLLRAAEPEDAEAITALMNQPCVRHGTLRTPFTTPEENQHLVAPNDAVKSIVAVVDGVAVGIGVLQPGRNRRAHCGDIQLIAVHDAYARRGIATALLAALIDLADNAAAVALYQRLGFVCEGSKRTDVFRNGAYADALRMARLR